jgi:RNA polymerase sigma-70 factor (ECF subfamily)
MQGELKVSDGALLESYVSGDPRAAALLFQRHKDALWRYLLRKLKDTDLAEEGLQETFLRLLEQARKLVSHPRLEAWLFSVARNVSVDLQRGLRHRAASFSQLEGSGSHLPLTDSSSSLPEARLSSRELSMAILRAVQGLPDAEREVFLLRTQAQLPFRAIAEELGAPLNTVLSRMHRALQRVRRALGQEGWPEPRGGSAGGGAP